MGKIRKILLMEEHVCPSWLYFSLGSFLRKKIHDPKKIFMPYVKEGETVIDIGCGPGFFTMGLAGLVGRKGKVIAVDIQKRAIDLINKKIQGTDLENIVIPLLAGSSDIGINEKSDFALTFWMLHEVKGKKAFINQIRDAMKPGALYLLVEPKLHVTGNSFADEVELAGTCGLELIDHPEIALSRSALFRAR